MEDVVFQHGTTEQINELAANLAAAKAQMEATQAELAPIKEALSGIHEIRAEARRAYEARILEILEDDCVPDVCSPVGGMGLRDGNFGNITSQ